MKKLLAIIDMQNDYIDGAMGIPEAKVIIPGIVSEIKKFIAADDEIALTQDTHDANYSFTQEGRKQPVLHCLKNSEGWELCPEIDELTQNYVAFEKFCFGSYELAHFVARGHFDEVTLVGTGADTAIISNALMIKGLQPEVPIKVIADCCIGSTPEAKEIALKAMAQCQVEIQ